MTTTAFSFQLVGHRFSFLCQVWGSRFMFIDIERSGPRAATLQIHKAKLSLHKEEIIKSSQTRLISFGKVDHTWLLNKQSESTQTQFCQPLVTRKGRMANSPKFKNAAYFLILTLFYLNVNTVSAVIPASTENSQKAATEEISFQPWDLFYFLLPISVQLTTDVISRLIQVKLW